MTTLAFAATATATTFTVTDPGDGAGSCPGTCTLRAALTAANGNGNPGTTDTIVFSGSGTVTLGATSLPAPTEPVKIDAGAFAVEVSGSLAYTTACLADDSQYALDLTAPGASGSSVRGVAFNSVCGRAIKSSLAAPSLSIGPRRHDNTLPIVGAGPVSATAADLFTADSGDAQGEAAAFVTAQTVSGGVFSYVPPVEPSPGALYAATFTDTTTSSTFSSRAAVPADIVSPSLTGAVTLSRYTARVDFSETIAPGSVAPADFSLTVGGLSRPVTAAVAQGGSALIDTSSPWAPGETGNVALTAPGAVTDLSGNELLGAPSARVFPGSGKTDKPQIRSLSISPSSICKKKTKRCKRTATKMRVSLSESARIVTTIVRAGGKPKQILRFRDKLEAGVSWVKIKNEMVGRKLPRGVMVATVVAEDVARNVSDPADSIFRVR